MKLFKPIVLFANLALLLMISTLFSCLNSDDTFEENGEANIRIIQVNSATDAVLIGNFGAASLDITAYWLCTRQSYVRLGDLTNVSLDLGGNQFVVLNRDLNDISSDVALYSSNDFDSPEAMVDFMQYGADVGASGRVDVAVSKGIWEEGTFVENSSPYTYQGDGDQSGVGFWQGFVDQSGSDSRVRLLQVDPDSNTITLKNFGSDSQDLRSYFICNERGYALVSSLVNTQDIILGPDETIELNRQLNPSASDVALYQDDAFESANSMVDFMQYGADTGNAGRQNVAVTKGIWTFATFVGGSGPYDYVGTGSEVGASSWEGN